VQCRAQSIVDILEGAQGPHAHPLAAACVAAGIVPVADGYGLLALPHQSGGTYTATGYFTGAADHASLAATTPDATAGIRAHAQRVESAIGGMVLTAAMADSAAVSLVKTPTDAVALAQVVTTCAQLYSGGAATASSTSNTANTGAADALTAYAEGQLMATLALVPRGAGASGG